MVQRSCRHPVNLNINNHTGAGYDMTAHDSSNWAEEKLKVKWWGDCLPLLLSPVISGCHLLAELLDVVAAFLNLHHLHPLHCRQTHESFLTRQGNIFTPLTSRCYFSCKRLKQFMVAVLNLEGLARFHLINQHVLVPGIGAVWSGLWQRKLSFCCSASISKRTNALVLSSSRAFCDKTFLSNHSHLALSF